MRLHTDGDGGGGGDMTDGDGGDGIAGSFYVGVGFELTALRPVPVMT